MCNCADSHAGRWSVAERLADGRGAYLSPRRARARSAERWNVAGAGDMRAATATLRFSTSPTGFHRESSGAGQLAQALHTAGKQPRIAFSASRLTAAGAQEVAYVGVAAAAVALGSAEVVGNLGLGRSGGGDFCPADQQRDLTACRGRPASRFGIGPKTFRDLRRCLACLINIRLVRGPSRRLPERAGLAEPPRPGAFPGEPALSKGTRCRTPTRCTSW